MFTDRIETATAVSENGAPSHASIVLPNAANEVLDQHGHQNSKAMVVDDESSNVKTLRTYLADEGFHNFVATASTPIVLECIRQRQPSIFLLDVADLAESEAQVT